jgi:hypothetical protein
MRRFKPLIASLALLFASCGPVYAIEPVGEDGKTFRFTDEEVEFCKANGGCTVVSNDEAAKVSQMLILLQQALAEAEKQLKAEQSKRCL